MKKKGIVVLSCILSMAMTVGVFAATSIHGGIGSKISGIIRGNGSQNNGSSKIVKRGVTKNANKEQSYTTAVHFVGASDGGHAATAAPGSETKGLPEKIVANINSINSGESVSETTGLKNLAGYRAMDKTAAIITTDDKGKIADVPTRLTLYVPNIVEGKDIKVIAYSNITGKWSEVPVHGINYQKKTIDITVNGSSTVCVIYK